MKSLLSTAGLAESSGRHPWRVIIAWVVILVLAGASAGLLNTTTEANFTNKPESVRGTDLIDDRLGHDEAVSETVLVQSETMTVDDPAFRQVVEQTTTDLLGLDGIVTGASNYYQAKDAGSPQADGLVSPDRHTALISVSLGSDYEDASKHANEYLDAVNAERVEGINIYTVGDVSANEEFNTIAEKDLLKAEVFGLPITLLILVVVFGALVAAGIPLILAVTSIFVSTGLAALISQAFELSFFVTNMISMIGLAVGIDYSLFVIARYREERRHGRSKDDAIAIAGGTASKAVVFSGMTVVLALIGMFLIPTTIFRSLAIGAILAVVIAVAATLTLVPALLRLIGDRINWPRRIKYDTAAVEAQRRYDQEVIHRGFWGTITRVVMRHPVFAVVLALTILVSSAIPYFDLKTGQSGIETLPDGDTKTAFLILQKDFFVGRLTPVKIVIDANASDPEVQHGVATLTNTMQADGQFGAPATEVNPAGDLTLIEVPLKTDANAQESYDAVQRLRNNWVPQAFGGTPAEDHVYVTGQTAFNADFNSMLDRYTPIVFTFVLGLSFILLMLAFRSLVVPIKAILMNLLSVGAAYGLMVLVFQKGYLTSLFGFQETPTIDAWIPIFLFCVLFGLSMDYHVFLLSRIREHYDQTQHNRESVAVGLQSTARIITGAALIMVVVFSSFAAGRLVPLQQMGFGLAVAVFIDATIIRSILVPASMALLGNVNWYLPRWLHWIPDLRVEGAAAHAPIPAPAFEVSATD